MKIKCKDFFEDVKTYEDYEFNTILSDIPYNLGSQWIIDDDGSYQIKGKKKAVDFMNRWDGLDGNDLDLMFKEMFRVMKFGGYLLLFGLDRQLGPLHYYAVKNGFEINQSLYWYFVSNFPKATDAGKMLDKRLKKEREVVGPNPNNKHKGKGSSGDILKHPIGQLSNITAPASELAKVFDGYKYSKAPLKQMVETICIFSKPTKNKSVLDDIIEWSEGVDLLNYAPKVGKKERNMGLDNVVPTTDGAKGNGINRICSVCSTPQLKKELCKCENPEWIYPPMKNTHPTLKPIKLISEIAKLFKLPDIVDQKVYIPFSGSGSEVIGFLDAGYNHKNITACEMNPEYVEISKKRIKHFYDENKS